MAELETGPLGWAHKIGRPEMATFDQVTVTGSNNNLTDVGFQTNWKDGGPIRVGAEITGRVVGVKGIADPQTVGVGGPGNGVEGYGYFGGSGVLGQGPDFYEGPGVTGQGGIASAPQVDGAGHPFGGVPGGPGVSGQGGAATAGNAVAAPGQEPIPEAAPAGPGVTGVGGPGAVTSARRPDGIRKPALGAPGPGVIGTGGTPVDAQELAANGVIPPQQSGGAGVIGVAGGQQIDLSQTGGYGGVFTSSQQGQVQLVPATGPGVPLPSTAQAGDLFVRQFSDSGQAELWFCSSPLPGASAPVRWNRVAFDQVQEVP